MLFISHTHPTRMGSNVWGVELWTKLRYEGGGSARFPTKNGKVKYTIDPTRDVWFPLYTSAVGVCPCSCSSWVCESRGVQVLEPAATPRDPETT